MSIFDSRLKGRIKVSQFRPSYTVEGTFYPGRIYPIMAKKVMPGDTWHVASNPVIRFQPLISPVLTNIKVDIRYFYCRNMLVWPNFDQYITGKQRYANTASNVVHPYFSDFELSTATSWHKAFYDWMYGACNTNVQCIYHRLDSLPARIYNMIFNEYYKDEFISTPASQPVADGPDNYLNFLLRNSCYKKDYFTSALPFPQWGDGVALPAEVVYDQRDAGRTRIQHWVAPDGTAITSGDAQFGQTPDSVDVNGGIKGQKNASGSPYDWANLDPNGTLWLNVDIRELRTANAIQRFLERSAMAGNRYAEFILAHFGVRTADNSSFRPQYLGGGSQYVNISPVEQNSESGSTPQGTLAGRGSLNGLVGMNHHYFFTEHGWIMALMCVRPDSVYAGGVQRQFYVNPDRLENYCIPGLQNIGMQEIKNKELCYTGENVIDDDTFGYTERYIDYKSFPNEAHGELLGSMNSWVILRNFSGQGRPPQLNDAFLNVPHTAFSENMAVNDYPPLVGSIHHDIRVKRPLQYRSTYKM